MDTGATAPVEPDRTGNAALSWSAVGLKWIARLTAIAAVVLFALVITAIHRGRLVQASAKDIVATLHTNNGYFDNRVDFTTLGRIHDQVGTLHTVLGDLDRSANEDVDLLDATIPDVARLLEAGRGDVRIAQRLTGVSATLRDAAKDLHGSPATPTTPPARSTGASLTRWGWWTGSTGSSATSTGSWQSSRCPVARCGPRTDRVAPTMMLSRGRWWLLVAALGGGLSIATALMHGFVPTGADLADPLGRPARVADSVIHSTAEIDRLSEVILANHTTIAGQAATVIDIAGNLDGLADQAALLGPLSHAARSGTSDVVVAATPLPDLLARITGRSQQATAVAGRLGTSVEDVTDRLRHIGSGITDINHHLGPLAPKAADIAGVLGRIERETAPLRPLGPVLGRLSR